MRILMPVICTALAAAACFGQVTTEPLTYRHGDVELEGFLAYDEKFEGKRPAVIVIHEWWGLNDFARQKARKLAELGYVAFAIDMYGKGVVTDSAEEASKLAGPFGRDPALMRVRARAGYEALVEHPRVDRSRIGAIGFCFGGAGVQHMAYDGLDLKGVVSFHGNPIPVREEEAAGVKAAILVLHGAADTLIPDAAMQAYLDAMRKTKIDWQLVSYGGAKHSFTNPAADALGMEGVGYDRRTHLRAWEAMRAFFTEVFSP